MNLEHGRDLCQESWRRRGDEQGGENAVVGAQANGDGQGFAAAPPPSIGKENLLLHGDVAQQAASKPLVGLGIHGLRVLGCLA